MSGPVTLFSQAFVNDHHCTTFSSVNLGYLPARPTAKANSVLPTVKAPAGSCLPALRFKGGPAGHLTRPRSSGSGMLVGSFAHRDKGRGTKGQGVTGNRNPCLHASTSTNEQAAGEGQDRRSTSRGVPALCLWPLLRSLRLPVSPAPHDTRAQQPPRAVSWDLLLNVRSCLSAATPAQRLV